MEALMKTHGRLAAEIRSLQGGDEKRIQRLWRLSKADLVAVKKIYTYKGQRQMERLVRLVEKESA